MPQKLKIGIDIDNVLADTQRAYLEKFNQSFGKRFVYEELIKFSHLEEKIGLTRQESEIFFTSTIYKKDFALAIKPFEDAKVVIQNWVKAGYSIHYITARSQKYKRLTRKWLKNNGFLFAHVTLDLIDEEKYPIDSDFKKEVIAKLGINIMIEDSPDIARALTIPVLLIDRPWNQGSYTANIYRVSGWEEIDRFISEFTAFPF